MAGEKLMPAYSDYPESAAGGTPATGHVRVYAKADGNMYQKDDAGVETALAGGGSGTIGGNLGATDNRIARSDGMGGLTIQGSSVGLDNNGYASGLRTILNATQGNQFAIGENFEYQLSSDSFVVADASYRNISIAAETGTADDLQSIDGSALFLGETVYLTARVGDTITVKHNLVNIFLYGAADFVLSETNPLKLTLIATNLWVDDALRANLTSGVTGVLPIANGGTNANTQTAAMDNLSPTSTKGDLLVDNGTNVVRLPVGANYKHIRANSAISEGVEWIQAVTYANKVYKFAADQTTTSTSFSDVDATNAAITLTAVGNGMMLVQFTALCNKDTAGSGYLRITDGTLNSDETELEFISSGLYLIVVRWQFATTAGSKTYKLQFRSSNANTFRLSEEQALTITATEFC